MTILVTGGAGFIGSNFVLDWCAISDEVIVNLDKLTYAGNRRNLISLDGSDKHVFVRGDIGDSHLVASILAQYSPRAIINFAAESHVDRSISGPADFIETNVVGTFRLLECARAHWLQMDAEDRAAFRFLHVSTDEVYGTLGAHDPAFSESTPYAPNSPYAASKAASDHLVRAWHHTYGIPVITTNCSNNYGPYHFPEKLIPLCIHNALAGRKLPIYGDGQQIRDWLYVKDHVAALRLALACGKPGQTYNIGGNCERTNLVTVRQICSVLDVLCPRSDGKPYAAQIEFVKDRPGHDRRYAVDTRRIRDELGWEPAETFESGIRQTVEWYLGNRAWVDDVTSGSYRGWITQHYRR